ncbi:MAG: hypothetical protein KJO25_02950, partial [Bacteroidia bacterium]|nr:hypothetical protein [Bacteroidia bacterium]
MSRIKSYISVIFVVFFMLGHAQNSFETDSLYKANEIELALHNAQLEEERGNYYEAMIVLEKALTVS